MADTPHARKVQAALEAITAVFSDKSVSRDGTRSSLKDLSGEIDTLLDALDDDDAADAPDEGA